MKLNKLLFFLILIYGCKNNLTKHESVTLSNIITKDSPLNISAYVDNANPLHIERIRYTIKFDYLDGVDFKLPEYDSNIAGLNIVDFKKNGPRKLGNKYELRQDYTLEPDLDGTYIIPALEIEYEFEDKKNKVSTNPIYINVALHEVTNTELIEDNFLLKIRNDRILFFSIIGFLLIIILFSIIYFLRFHKKQKFIEPQLLPHEKALKSLHELILTNYIKKGEFRKFYFMLSEIARKYTDERFLVSTLESTHEEIKVIFQTNTLLPEDFKNNLLLFFERSDYAKYAKMTYKKEQMTQDVEMIKAYINFTTKIDKNGIENKEVACV